MHLLRGVGGALAHARLPLVALALALHAIGLVITGERWRVVVAALGSRLRLSRTTLINLAGIFVRNATPTIGLGGDASRIALLRADGVPLAQATASFAYVRLAEVPPLAVVVAPSTPAVASVVRRSHTALVVTGAVIVVGIAIAWLARHRLRAHVTSIWTRTGHLVSRSSGSLHQSQSAAPAWQGERSAHIGNMQATSNSARPGVPNAAAALGWRRDAPPGR